MLQQFIAPNDGPFALLSVLRVSRNEATPARYQSPADLSFNDVIDFLERFRDYLEKDARHALWIIAVGTPGLRMIYDHHDLVYAYGPENRIRAELSRRGFREHDFDCPHRFRHAHRYHDSFDESQRLVLNAAGWDWMPFDLQAVDDP